MARVDLGTSSAMVGIFLQKIHVELGTVSTKFPNFWGTTLQCRELFDLLDLRIVFPTRQFVVMSRTGNAEKTLISRVLCCHGRDHGVGIACSPEVPKNDTGFQTI